MLDGQLLVLEAPEADEDFVAADIRQTPAEIVEAVVRTFSDALTPAPGPQR
jgi:gluconate kinase